MYKGKYGEESSSEKYILCLNLNLDIYTDTW